MKFLCFGGRLGSNGWLMFPIMLISLLILILVGVRINDWIDRIAKNMAESRLKKSGVEG